MTDRNCRVNRKLALLLMVACLWSFGALPAEGAPYAAAEEQLKSLSLEQLGKLQVTTVSKQPEEVWKTPAAVYVLTQDDIRRSGATSLPELLRLVPGVQVSRSQSDQWAVAIRGFNSQFSKAILVLIDGRSVYTPLFEGVYWDVQDLVFEDIDRIEVIRGPAASIWGPNAVNGVINIVTKRASETQGSMASAAGGSPVDRFTGEIQQGLRPTNRFQFRVFAKGFNRGPELNPGHDPYDRWHQERGGFRADWEPAARDTLTASADIYQGKSGAQTVVGEFFPPEQLVTDAPEAVSGGNLNIRWNRQVNSRSNFYLQGYFDRTNRRTPQFSETRNTFDLDFIDHIASLPRQDIILGAGLRQSPSYILQRQATVDFEPHRQNDFIYSWFLQDSLQLVPNRLELTLGSKFEDNNFSGLGTEPSARLLWNPSAHQAIWGAVSRALRIPGRLDRNLTLIGNAVPAPPLFVEIRGNPKFRPEVLIGWEAGYRQLLTQKLFVDVAAF
ncbi:MAG TPA: TonB-dependent receptor, partial [Acidobacteriaceae bacterium]|nr:TonB-dependent receptor [Acidobacteriaceae bacterium]